MSTTFDNIFSGLFDGSVVPYLGAGALNGVIDPASGKAIPADSDTVMPTVIITDKDSKIVWTHETDNYRVRPEPDIFLEVLRRHGVVAA